MFELLAMIQQTSHLELSTVAVTICVKSPGGLIPKSKIVC